VTQTVNYRKVVVATPLTTIARVPAKCRCIVTAAHHPLLGWRVWGVRSAVN